MPSKHEHVVADVQLVERLLRPPILGIVHGGLIARLKELGQKPLVGTIIGPGGGEVCHHLLIKLLVGLEHKQASVEMARVHVPRVQWYKITALL